VFVDYGIFTASAFNAVFREGEIPQTSMSDDTGAGPINSSTSIPSSGPRPFSGFSGRAAAGIGVGVALGILSLSSFGFFLSYRRSRRQKRQQQQGTMEEPSDEYRAELHNEHKLEIHDGTVAARELDTPHKLDRVVTDSVEPVEMDTPEQVDVHVEADDDAPVEADAPAELDAEEQLENAGEKLKERP
jgi:hypothetical protein